MTQYTHDGKPIVYLDESGFMHDMPRTHGYSMKGERCFGTHDWGAKGRTNAIGALLDKALLTVSLFEHNIDTQTFTHWVKEDLMPKLPDGCVIVLDNAAFHKNKDMQYYIKNAGHILEYLPAYSPDLNPIEHKWAQAKSIRRKYQCDIDQLFRDYCP
ncbi:IS630 family transposase [Rickettsia endosymbiont of Polydrusus tereticollis]|uniref:IS630 family transposase n=1 Tax=Rickettsia endosymbiont of Polydrusus tereticollis TaxID=3066251 RepID=UPI003132F2FC